MRTLRRDRTSLVGSPRAKPKLALDDPWALFDRSELKDRKQELLDRNAQSFRRLAFIGLGIALVAVLVGIFVSNDVAKTYVIVMGGGGGLMLAYISFVFASINACPPWQEPKGPSFRSPSNRSRLDL
jgi:hypothetical protein